MRVKWGFIDDSNDNRLSTSALEAQMRGAKSFSCGKDKMGDGREEPGERGQIDGGMRNR